MPERVHRSPAAAEIQVAAPLLHPDIHPFAARNEERRAGISMANSLIVNQFRLFEFMCRSNLFPKTRRSSRVAASQVVP